MITDNNISKIVILCIALIGTSIVCGGLQDDNRDEEFRFRFNKVKSKTRLTGKAQKPLLSIQIKTAKTCKFSLVDKSCSIATIQIKNISRSPVAIFCDPSPRALTYLRIESIGLKAAERNLDVNTREIIFDIGDLLSKDNDISKYVLQPKDTIDMDVDISPLFYCDLIHSDVFAIRAELRSAPYGWVNTPLTPPTIHWVDRAIVSEQSIITVNYGW